MMLSGVESLARDVGVMRGKSVAAKDAKMSDQRLYCGSAFRLAPFGSDVP